MSAKEFYSCEKTPLRFILSSFFIFSGAERTCQNAHFFTFEFPSSLPQLELERSASNSLAWRSHRFNLVSRDRVRETRNLRRLFILRHGGYRLSYRESWNCSSRRKWRRLSFSTSAIKFNKKLSLKIDRFFDSRCMFYTFEISLTLRGASENTHRGARGAGSAFFHWGRVSLA
jgi:hypothetical protein